MEILVEEETKEFISRLPELSVSPSSTVHLVMLAVRSRLAREMLGFKIRDLVVERKIVRPIENWRGRYFDVVYNLALLQKYGRHRYRKMLPSREVKYVLIPFEAKAVFGTLSPRNTRRAVAEVMKRNADELYKGDESSKLVLSRQEVLYFGMLHKYKAQGTAFATLDLDKPDWVLCKEILEIVESAGIPIFMVTETSRGYHIVLNLSNPEHARIFYGQESLLHKLRLQYAKEGLEIQKDSQEPIPGTYYHRHGDKAHYVRILI